MPTSNTQLIDPEGQAVMDGFISAGADPETAYNATQGVRKMSGDQVIAEIRDFRGEFQALTADVQALTANVQSLTTNVQSLTVDLQALTANVQSLTTNVQTLTVDVQTLEVDVQTLTAELRAHEAASSAQLAAMDDRINGSSTQLDIVSWAVIATFAIVTLFTATGMLRVLGLEPQRRKSKKRGRPRGDVQKRSEPTS